MNFKNIPTILIFLFFISISYGAISFNSGEVGFSCGVCEDVFYSISNPLNFVNKTQTDSYYYNKTEIDNNLDGYWKSDGTSTATGDWDLGDYDLSFTGGDVFTAYGYFGLGDESNLNLLLGTNDAYLGYSPPDQDFTYLYFGYPNYGSFEQVQFVLGDTGSNSFKINDNTNDNQIALSINDNPVYSYFRVDVEGRNVIYATPEYTSMADLLFSNQEYLNFGSNKDFRFGVDGEESMFLDTKVNADEGTFKVKGDLAVYDNSSLGSDKITNGDFATDASSWTLGTGWSYDTGKVVKVGAGGNTGKLVQTSANMVTPLEVGKLYELSMDVGKTTKDYANFYVNIAGYTSRVYYDIDTTLKFYFVAKTTDDLEITPNHYNTDFTIDNVTLKEVQAGDFSTGGDIYSMGNIEAVGNISGDTAFFNDYITNSKVPDIKDGKKGLDNLKNINKWLDSDKNIKYDEHYAYKKYYTKEKDYTRPITKIIEEEYCEDVRDYENPEDVKCWIVKKEVITYPYEIEVEHDGLSMETRVSEMEKMIYELQSELCIYKKYSWCNN